MNMNKVAYILNKNLRMQCDKLPTMFYRATRIIELINAYELLSAKNIVLINNNPATENELTSYHNKNYISFIKKLNEGVAPCEEQLSLYGLEYDCPLLNDMYAFISAIAGSSLTAAKVLLNSDIKTVINWFGGWHHAQKGNAEGFCYVNDIVLAIQKLLIKFERVLYLDLDVHHGNGVENAFINNKNVLTMSIHKLSPGFYPGTGQLNDIGLDDGEYYNINVPLLDGFNDNTYKRIFESLFPRIVDFFQPTAMVVQCGADILQGDPTGQCNVTLHTMGDCCKLILGVNIPTIFLGGGGYNFQNTARYWTFLTSIILGTEISEEIPDDSEFFTEYSPTYELHIDPGNIKDKNTDEYLTYIIDTIVNNCNKLKD